MILRILSIFMFVLYLAFALFLAATTEGDMGPAGTPVGFDFSAYYEAAQFARHGEAAHAYDDATFLAAEQARFPQSTTKLPWNYPPIFQAFLLPFSALSYFDAFAVWTTLLLGAHIAFTRRVVAPPALWPLLLFPGAAINLFLGTSGLLVALLIGCGLMLLDRRPLLSGFFFALALFKPHLAVLLPIALLADRRYRALTGMLGTTAILVVGTTMMFGSSAWLAFFAKATHAGDVVTSSSSGWTRVPTLYTLMQVIGFGKTIAGIVHVAMAIAAVGCVTWLWRSRANLALRGGALALGLLIVTPYARIYDFALLIFPILALIDDREHMKTEDRVLVALAWIAPLIGLLVRAATPWLSLLLPVLLARLMMRAMKEPPPQTAETTTPAV